MEEFNFDAAPPAFQEVRPLVQTIFLISGTGWLVNYVTTIRTAFRDRTSGVSLIGLCNNLAWELVFVLIHRPPHLIAAIVIGLWLFVNVFVVYATVKFAQESKPDSLLLQRHLPLFVVISILGFFSGHVALTVHLGPTKALYWGGMMCLVTLSASALGVLVQRGHTRGTSYAMW
jgi:paspaline synthase